ncbi:MAG: EAL domain-containing protein, partial [Geobacter sp.]
RTKMTLAVSGLVLLLMLITAGGTLSYFERLHEASVRTNQANVVRLLSMNVDNSLRYAKDALQRNADNLPEQALQSEAGALTFLKSRTGLYNFFTGHLFMFAVDGRLIAEYPSLAHDQHRLSSFAGQPAFKKALATSKPQVSSPTACCAADDGLQAFMFVPVVRNGRIRAVLAGSVDLKRPNRLSEHMQEPSGVNGVIRLISDDYQVVAHVNPELTGRQSVTEVTEAIDQALKQGSVALTNTNRYQLPTFTYLHRLETADWVLAASIPVDEVYAPVRTVRTWFILATLLGMAAAVLVVFLVMRLLTRPVEQLARHVEQLSHKQGSDRLIHLDTNGEIGRLIKAFNTMVQEVEQRTFELQESEQRYRVVSEFSNDFTYWRRPDDNFEFVSPSCLEVTGYSVGEFYSNPQLMEEIIHPADRHLLEAMESQPENGTCQGGELEYRITTKDGSTRWIRRNCRPIYDEQNQYLGRRGSLCDITDKKLLADQVSHLVLHDLLTGLPNRTLFVDRLTVHTPRTVTEHGLMAVLFFGLDRFKLINDTMGHEVGDRLLIMTAERLRALLHADDTLCRFGGDVFAFILQGRESKHEAVTMAYRILASLNDPFAINASQQVLLTGSIGIALCPNDGKDPETLLKNAETAMYDAKRGGKNSFRFYSRDMNAQAAEMLALDNSMPTGLANGDFYLHYQPQLDLKSDRVVGMEALLRWRHPELGFISPDRFIPLAEESGFIIKLGEWVLRSACFQNAAWIKDGLPQLRIAVNISGRQFIEPDFVDQVAAALADSGLPPGLLELELTESMLVSDQQQALQRLRVLKKMGVQLAIDDFGTGYSSLSYLKHFPLDRLKIDKSFINDILVDPDDAAITDAIIAMAHSLKLQVITEGVETIEQLAFLEDRGCDEIQGYHLSKPLSERDLTSFIRARAENQ